MPPPPRKPQGYLTQLFALSLIQLSNWRWSWRSQLVTGTLAPLGGVLGLGVFARDLGAETLGYVLAGNLVVALMFGNVSKVASNFAFMRAMGTLHYFATLPVRRHALVLATVLAFSLLSLPSVVITALVGSWFLELPLHPHPLLLLVVPLAAVPMASLGALIGTLVRLPEEATSLGLLLTLLMMAIGPVVVPPDRLPPWLLWLGHLSPATYAASALRQSLLGPVTSQILVDLVVLLLVAGVVAWLVVRRMDWRQ